MCEDDDDDVCVCGLLSILINLLYNRIVKDLLHMYSNHLNQRGASLRSNKQHEGTINAAYIKHSVFYGTFCHP